MPALVSTARRPALSAPWLFSARVDLGIVLGPLGIALLLLLLIESSGVKTPLWAYLLAFVAVDVAHVWATATLTFLDRERFVARRSLYLILLFGSFALALGLQLWSEQVFWSFLAYFAIFHFARQQWGFICLYARRAGLVTRWGRRIDAAVLTVGVLVPVITWHAAPVSHFDWFDAGERFLVRPPAEVIPWLWFLLGITAVAYIVWQAFLVKKGDVGNLGKWLWMAGSWVSWIVGLRLTDDLLLSAAFLNFFHGAPFLMLVYRRVRHRWHEQKVDPKWWGDRLLVAVTRRGRFYLFYALVLFPALIEESLWDLLIWRSYFPLFAEGAAASLPHLSGILRTCCIALLITPQLAHYFLDGVLWKRSPFNDDLRTMFSVDGATDEDTSAEANS